MGRPVSCFSTFLYPCFKTVATLETVILSTSFCFQFFFFFYRELVFINLFLTKAVPGYGSGPRPTCVTVEGIVV